ncbi:rhomboid family intramembrane serine protease [Nocardioides mangrovicus]|uniref:Rhomboid family intramembrane serine protease n=1 Tax=Nocardioides mangrovicus TaxID=2478913 RepID=A0A3L8P6R4_9ACTN|nr:rhomboid family intramembrane serine protease [Nocardioides mangrovicus]RLV50319.1 rhomboid family intramembrane serine protease [Nocardioides mangrovicus]
MSEVRPVDRGSTWLQAVAITLGFTALLWLVQLANAADHGGLDQYGVHPRSEEGLLGIAFAPLLHAGWAHLEGNTVPVMVLGFLVLLGGIARGLLATLVVWVVAGAGVWLTAPANSIHLGASVLVFGWLVYLVVRGFVTGRIGEIVLGLVLLVLYGTVLLGVLPGQPGVSWQGHLFGAIGGGLAAFWVSGRRTRPRL